MGFARLILLPCIGGQRLLESFARATLIVSNRARKKYSSTMKLMTLAECAKRWLHFLNPELDYSEWTPPEDERLLAEVEKNGRNWRRIVDEVLTGRSATDAKNRFVTPLILLAIMKL